MTLPMYVLESSVGLSVELQTKGADLHVSAFATQWLATKRGTDSTEKHLNVMEMFVLLKLRLYTQKSQCLASVKSETRMGGSAFRHPSPT